MRFYRRPGPADIGKPLTVQAQENIRVFEPNNVRQVENADDAFVANLPTLLGRVVETSMGDIDHLIDELQALRERLQGDSDRIRTDIAKHAALSEQVMQVTKIVSDSVHKLPEAPSITV